MLLSHWRGRIAYVMARCQITGTELAIECKTARQYLSRVLNDENPSEHVRSWVEKGLRSCVERRGYDFDELFKP